MKRAISKTIILIVLCCLILCSCSDVNVKIITQESSKITGNSFVAHFLDVGQGDSIFLELPNSQTMLIDAAENMYGKGIISYINDLGYDRIDYLVATHPHSDHIGSMSYIVKHMDIGEVYMPKVSTTTKTYENLLSAISDKDLKIKSAKADMNIVKTEDFSINILGPVTIDEKDLNNCSLVLKAEYGNTSYLFTGDAETKEINQITTDLSADVLKVGHHGSKTSTTKKILKKISPDIAVISVGEDNDYGHPHSSTIKYLKAANATVYRTDEDNTISVTSDGENITVETGRLSIKKDN